MAGERRSERMKTVRDLISGPPVWVNPEHTTEAAVVFLRGFSFGALPVLDGNNLVGMIQYDQLLVGRKDAFVSGSMESEIPSLHPDMSAAEAARVLIESGKHRLPVIEGDRLIGVITTADLLPAVNRTFDPLTELPWSDSLRKWAIDHLQATREITILFVDLDRFGVFNKKYGHLVGDEVLRKVASTLMDSTDPERDYVSKYGGDEFVVGTLRTSEEAQDLAGEIIRAIDAIRIEEHESERISCSIGLAGGKRSREREPIHYAATFNSLINLASKDCIAHKAETAELAVISARVGERRPRLTVTDVTWAGPKVSVRIEMLGKDGKPVSLSTSAETDEIGALRLVAETTVGVLRQIMPDGYDLKITEVVREQTAAGQTYVSVVGMYITPHHSIPVAGSAVAAQNLYRASANAVLATVNRLIARQHSEPAAP